MAGAVISRAVTALVLNKVVALFYGPTGITLLAHLQNLLTLVVQLPNDGVNRGAINLYQFASDEEKRPILKKVLLYNFAITVVITAILIIAKDYFWEKFYPISPEIDLIVIFGLSIFFIVGHYSFLSIYQGYKRYARYAFITAISSLILLFSGAIVTYYFELKYFLLIYLVAQALGFIASFLFYLKDYSYLKKLKASVNIDIRKPIFQFILMALSVWLFTYLFDFIIRNFAISNFGYDQTGEWQAVVKISDQLKAVFVATTGAVFFTEVSSRLADSLSLKEYLGRTLVIILPLVFFALVFIYLIREPLLIILYSNKFVEAEKFFFYQLLGDFFAMFSYFFMYIIMAQRRTISYIFFQAFSGVLYLLFIYFLTPLYQLEGIVMAYCFRYILFLFIVVYYSRKLFHR